MKTILLVEDDTKVRDMIRKFLELNKFTVFAALNGEEGIEIAGRIMPDLIISDIAMPVMDGFSMKSELGKNDLTSTIPFIFLTSMSDRDKVRKGMELGADDYLTKPVSLEELKKAISTQLEKREKLLNKYISASRKNSKKEISSDNHVLIKDRGVPRFIKINSIIYISAELKYSKVALTSGEKIISSHSLKNWEKILPDSKFIRIHRATIINLEYIDKIERWFNRSYRLKLHGIASDFEISRRYYSKLLELYEGEL